VMGFFFSKSEGASAAPGARGGQDADGGGGDGGGGSSQRANDTARSRGTAAQLHDQAEPQERGCEEDEAAEHESEEHAEIAERPALGAHVARASVRKRALKQRPRGKDAPQLPLRSQAVRRAALSKVGSRSTHAATTSVQAGRQPSPWLPQERTGTATVKQPAVKQPAAAPWHAPAAAESAACKIAQIEHQTLPAPSPTAAPAVPRKMKATLSVRSFKAKRPGQTSSAFAAAVAASSFRCSASGALPVAPTLPCAPTPIMAATSDSVAQGAVGSSASRGATRDSSSSGALSCGVARGATLEVSPSAPVFRTSPCLPLSDAEHSRTSLTNQWRCEVCDISFGSPQALGAHRTHSKQHAERVAQVMAQAAAPDVVAGEGAADDCADGSSRSSVRGATAAGSNKLAPVAADHVADQELDRAPRRRGGASQKEAVLEDRVPQRLAGAPQKEQDDLACKMTLAEAATCLKVPGQSVLTAAPFSLSPTPAPVPRSSGAKERGRTGPAETEGSRARADAPAPAVCAAPGGRQDAGEGERGGRGGRGEGGEPQVKRHRGLQLSSLTIIHTSAADALPEAQGSCASDSAAPAALDPSDEWDETWERHLQLLEAFKAVEGHPHAHNSDVGVGPWVKEQRQLFKDGKLSPAQEQRLRNIGFVFDRMAAAQTRTALELRNWGYYEEEEEEEEEGGLFKADAVNEDEEEEFYKDLEAAEDEFEKAEEEEQDAAEEALEEEELW